MGVYDRRPEDLDDPASTWARIAARLRPGDCVLDLGCYDGTLLAGLRDRSRIAGVGVERDPEAAARARARGLAVVVADLDVPGWEAALSARRFSAVVLSDVLEHVGDAEALLATLAARCLEPGGRLLLSVPNVAHGSLRIGLLLGDLDPRDAGILDRTHRRFFTLRTLHACLRDGGFSIAHVDRVEFDVPEEVATKWLARAGLSDPALVRWVTRGPEAATYQYVVEAVPAAARDIPHEPPAAAADATFATERLLRLRAAKIRRLEERVRVLEEGGVFRGLRYSLLKRRQRRDRRQAQTGRTESDTLLPSSRGVRSLTPFSQVRDTGCPHDRPVSRTWEKGVRLRTSRVTNLGEGCQTP